MSDIILETKNLHFQYQSRGETLPIVSGVDLRLHQGESIAIVGASGSGKSTLLHLLAGLDTPQQGEIRLCGQPFVSAEQTVKTKRSKMRNLYMGFVYQFHHLLAEFSAQENVAMPLKIRGEKDALAMQAAAERLSQVGLAERLTHKPSELSGGERQRAAIARALVHQPKCLLADEPTGNLDADNAAAVFALMKQLVQEQNSAMIIVTHDMNIARQTDHCYYLYHGQLHCEAPVLN
ncbi:ABC transporter ATP-binding protein [Suttonella ornithocola]|uniref:Lipoprotein-releasing system ATP-binding protein LolD n=1 Tax=Suttonella ornithocola TaxID=279832 RepID=A0A380MN83_9GAMM|nr:ATP-binding cassette domain-containing protein [Suttonella ornithocola]SUO93708.1 Lipoprotein-releasing system ATP-binding protein LolD [Suttonella ornithocola]